MKGRMRIYRTRSVEVTGCPGEFCQLDGEDVTALMRESGRLVIRPARQVQLLDLRRAFFSLF
jgi:hypothetical protein